MGERAFTKCYNLSYVYYEENDPPQHTGVVFEDYTQLKVAEVGQLYSGTDFCWIPVHRPSYAFTLSNTFTLCVQFSLSSLFSPISSPFTQSKIFTPQRTKILDPMNIFYSADVVRRNVSLFSKEEIKKAAAPITFFVVAGTTSVVFLVYYL